MGKLNIWFFFSICQEPGTNAEIKKFAQSFNVQFDMFEKIDVNGSSAHPVWVYLKAKQGGLLGKCTVSRLSNIGIDGLTDWYIYLS